MQNLFIIDGASGTGKTFLSHYVENYRSNCALVKKFTTRGERGYEQAAEWKLDLKFVTEEEFKKLNLDYQYRYSGQDYGFYKNDLLEALRNNSNVFVIVRNSNLIARLQKDFYFINTVPIFIYTDRDQILKRLKKLKKSGKMNQSDIDLRLERLNIAFRDYLDNSELYSEVIINNAEEKDFRRLTQLIIKKYSMAPKVDENLVFLLMSFNPENPNLQDYGIAIKKAVERVSPNLQCINLEDVKKGAYSISVEVKAQIRSCRLSIVDLTENKPNVYYELGFVHGINKDCILTAHSDTKPHFYPAGHKIIRYHNATELESKVYEEVKALFDRWN